MQATYFATGNENIGCKALKQNFETTYLQRRNIRCVVLVTILKSDGNGNSHFQQY